MYEGSKTCQHICVLRQKFNQIPTEQNQACRPKTVKLYRAGKSSKKFKPVIKPVISGVIFSHFGSKKNILEAIFPRHSSVSELDSGLNQTVMQIPIYINYCTGSKG